MIINQIRRDVGEDSEGREYCKSLVFINCKRFCYALEDTPRPYGQKIPGKTAIPSGVYRVSITFSNKYQRDMILIHDENSTEINKNGMHFDGVRVHGGNDVDDTDGCPLVAYNDAGPGKIYGRADKELFEQVKSCIDAGEYVYWIISEDF